MALVAAQLATERPDEVALRDDDVALRWAQVNDVLNRVVNGLGDFDLGPDRRVAVFAENSVETVLAHLGGLLAGTSTVPVNFHLNADEVAYILAGLGGQGAVRRAGHGRESDGRGTTGRRAGRHRLADHGAARRSVVGGLACRGVGDASRPRTSSRART